MDANPYESPSTDPLGSNTAASSGVTPRVVSELSGTKPWVRLLAVLGFLGAGFMILAGLGMSAMMMTQIGPGAIVIGALYALMGLIYLFPAIKLWKYGSAILQLQFSNSTEHLEEAMAQQRGFWKLTGIMIIVGFVLGILMSIGMGVLGFSMSNQGGFDIPLDEGAIETPNFELE